MMKFERHDGRPWYKQVITGILQIPIFVIWGAYGWGIYCFFSLAVSDPYNTLKLLAGVTVVCAVFFALTILYFWAKAQ